MGGKSLSRKGGLERKVARVQRYYRNKSMGEATLSFMDLLYVSIVREFRTTNGGAILSFFFAILRPLVIFIVFWVMYEVIGRSMIVRGDFLLFMMTGIMLYLFHIRAVKTLQKAGHAQAGMMFYARASTMLNVLSSAIYELYLNALAMMVILVSAYLIRGYMEIYDPTALLAPVFFAWASGLAVGMVFLAISPLAPGLVQTLFQVYRRAQMLASGKMFLANMIPASTLWLFTWNPLFHCIDQARGAAFINYLPRNTNMMYPIYFTLAAFFIGFLIEYALRAQQDRGIE